MSKYVIELREDCEIVQQICSNGKGVRVGSVAVECLEELNSDYINEHFGDLQDTAYQKGFEDGVTKRTDGDACTGCMYQDKTIEHHPCGVCCNAFKNQWTAKDDKTEVGDEVEWTGDKYIVTYINYNIDTSEITDYDLLGDDGSVADHVKKCSFVKTGRHFDIASILEEMRK